jgi:hypothetical protein
MRRYSCFGLVVESALDLPELAARTGSTDGPVDVAVRTGRLEPPPPDAVPLAHGLWRRVADTGEDRCGVDIDGVARYEVRDGREIVVDVHSGADPDMVRLFLLGTMMGAVLVQRGLLVLHGNAFRVGEVCAVVVGHSGAGKSTLAAEVERRGLDVLSDDVVPVDPAGRALPGYPRIKLWADALDRLGVPTEGLARVHLEHEKFELRLGRYAAGPLPVHTVYALELHDGPLELRPVHGIEAFGVLAEHTYRRELVHDRIAAAAHLEQCAALAGRAAVVRVLRPRDVQVGQTADLLLDDLADRGASTSTRTRARPRTGTSTTTTTTTTARETA